MDRLETAKTTHAANDAIIDDLAAKAYVENFALDTFTRAEQAQRDNKVTRQTADTFQAAATFFDTLAIWGAPDQEVAAKTKFAKFHALRIAKAIKSGEDPNATNPVVEEPQPPSAEVGEDGIEQELKDLETQNGSNYQPPRVESTAGSGQPSRAESTAPNGQLNLPPDVPPNAISPLDPAKSDRQGSVGGGYFPSLPSAPTTTTITTPPTHDPAISSPNDTDRDFGGQDIAHAPPPASMHTAATAAAAAPSPSSFYNPPAQPLPPTLAPAPAAFAPPPPAPPSTGYNIDDDSIAQAQKRAKWAISALNFEDVETAVRELRGALTALGAG